MHNSTGGTRLEDELNSLATRLEDELN